MNLHDTIADACLLVGAQLRSDGVIIQREFCSEVPRLLGDTLQLEQVFVNLLTNAHDAIVGQPDNDGGVIRIRTMVQGRRVFAEVLDDGPGVAPEVLDRLFEAFFTTKPLGKGTGLGLSISNSIIHDHGGSIAVCSAPGEACVFRIELPLLVAAQAT